MGLTAKWRLINSGACAAFYNMALDEAVAASVRKGDSPATLRLYGWDSPSLSIGCFQKTSDINIKYCISNNIPVVRRPTGGRAILHDDELTYSFSVRADEPPFSKGLLDSYRKISEAFSLAFRKAGINAESKKNREKGRALTRSPLCFRSSSFGEILVDNKKIVGSAQKRWTDGLLQQGSIPYSYNVDYMSGIFGAGKISALKDYMTGLDEIMPMLSEKDLKKIISKSFEEIFGIRLIPAHPSERESLHALEIEKLKYLQQSWNFRR